MSFDTLKSRKGGNQRNSRVTHPKKTTRQKNAAERASFRAKLSPTQQLDALDKRLGVGVGAVKERKRLTALVKATSTQKVVQTKGRSQ